MNLFNVDSDISYLLLTMGKQITINGSSATAIIGYSDNKDIEEKKIITKSPLKRGDLLVINDHNYLIYNEINGLRQDSYYKGYARSCNYNIRFKINGTDREFPSITESQFFNIATGKYFNSVDGEIYVTLQDNIYTSQIAIQNTFISIGNTWEVQGIDRTKTGLIILTCKITASTHAYTIETTNTDTSLTKNATLQFNVTVKDSSTALTSPALTYTSNNSNCSVSSTGLITALVVGTSIITATFTGGDGTTKSISITITVTEPVVTHSYAIMIDGSDTITQGASQTYTATVKDNGTAVTDKTVTWTLLNEAGTAALDASIATMSTSGLSCTVNGLKMGEYGTLKATLCDDTSISNSKSLSFIGGW